MSVEVGIPRRVSDLHGLHTLHGLRHRLDVRFLVSVGVEGKHGRNTLRDGLGGDHDDLFLRQGDGLLGRHDDVLIVRENENRFRRGRVDLDQNVLRGGIHGLPALDDLVRAQLPESRRKALARADGNHAEGLLCRGESGLFFQLFFDLFQIVRAACRAAGGKIVILHPHILDLRQLQRAVLLRLGQRLTGNVRVDMHLEGLVVLADDDAVADGVQISAQGLKIDILARLAHNIDRIEGEGNVAVAQLGKVCLLLHLSRRRVGLDLNAAVHGEHCLQHIQPALAARVHDARLFQHGVLMDGLGQRLLGGGHRRLQNGLNIRAFRGQRIGCGNARDGQNSSLGGLHDGLVGRLHAAVQRCREQHAVAVLRALEGLGDAAEEQRQDNAGVTARTAQHGRGDLIGSLGQVQLARLAQLVGGRVEGHAHVGAGIAVRHGEYVQLIDLLLVVFNGGSRAEDHFPKGRPVDGISHVTVHLPLSRSRWSRSPHRRPGPRSLSVWKRYSAPRK